MNQNKSKTKDIDQDMCEMSCKSSRARASRYIQYIIGMVNCFNTHNLIVVESFAVAAVRERTAVLNRGSRGRSGGLR